MQWRAISAAWAAVLLAQPAPAATFEMVTGLDYVPFTGEDLPAGGLAVDAMAAALEAQGHSLDVRFLPWKRGFQLTADGAVDGTFPYIHTDERAQEVRFSEPMFTVVAQVISSTDDPVRFDGTKASLDDKRLCLPVGYATEPLVSEMIDKGRISVLEARNLDQCPALVQSERADFMVHNNFVWPPLVAGSDYGRDAFHVAETSLKENQLHAIVGKEHPETARILTTINDGLAAIRADGTFDAIVDRHMQSQD